MPRCERSSPPASSVRGCVVCISPLLVGCCGWSALAGPVARGVVARLCSVGSVVLVATMVVGAGWVVGAGAGWSSASGWLLDLGGRSGRGSLASGAALPLEAHLSHRAWRCQGVCAHSPWAHTAWAEKRAWQRPARRAWHGGLAKTPRRSEKGRGSGCTHCWERPSWHEKKGGHFAQRGGRRGRRGSCDRIISRVALV